MIKQCFCIFPYFLQCQEALAGLLENHRVKAHTNPSQTLFHFLFCLSWLAHLKVMTGAAVWCIKNPSVYCTHSLCAPPDLSSFFLCFKTLSLCRISDKETSFFLFFFFKRGEKVENALNNCCIQAACGLCWPHFKPL